MTKWIKIKKHEGQTGKKFFTVHLMEGVMPIRILGRFTTKSASLAQARKMAVRFGARFDG